MANFYEIFPWWDTLLHFASGIILGILGFALVYFINKDRNVSLRLNPFFICAFSFTFVVTMGVFWEIFEFSVDQFLGMNMQKWQGGIRLGLIDTMTDLIIDTLGALIVAAVGYIYMRKDKKKFFKSIKESFREEQHKEEKF
jgi:VanZ family protein